MRDERPTVRRTAPAERAASGGETPPVRVRVEGAEARIGADRFAGPFRVGRGAECEVQVLDPLVSRSHLEIAPEGEAWRVRDLGSANGTYRGGDRVEELALSDRLELQLGSGGPALLLELEGAPEGRGAARETQTAAPRFASETQFIERYLKPSAEGGGRETMMIRRALARVQRGRSRRYQAAIGASLVLLALAGAYILHQHRKLQEMRATAERLFYAAKGLELQTEGLEQTAMLHADPKLVAELKERRQRIQEMEREYDRFVGELGLYRKASEQERVILKVARAFGECDLNVPPGFDGEVRRYVRRWRSTDRLAKALERAREHDYGERIARVLARAGLPPQFLFLALQESNFNVRAVGPPTRSGVAKGMWQFIPLTARRYGLHVGPQQGRPVYDPLDERFSFEKSTEAAAQYLRDLRTEAQASGLLVLASYNWGEDKVREAIERLPARPEDRNFWRLLVRKEVPNETYDYVLSIFSAAVICENPKLFGFDVPCPRAKEG